MQTVHSTQAGSLAISKVSILPGRGRAFKFFLFSMLGISIGAATIENGLSLFTLLSLPLLYMAIFRSDYSKPFLWSETVGTVIFFIYLPGFVLFSQLFALSFSLPVFLVYFTFGLLIVRALSPFTDRNIWQIIFLSVGLILINCILTNHLIFGLVLPLYLFALLGTLLLFHLAGNEAPLEDFTLAKTQSAFWNSWYGILAKYTLFIFGFTVILFVFFPRPFLVIPGLRAAMSAAAGFAQLDQNISYTDMAGMAGRKRIAFNVHLEKGSLPETPYWRGRVLEKTDGFTWKAVTESRGMSKLMKSNNTDTIVYTISPYKLNSKNLYVAGLPIRASGRFNRPLYISSEAEVIVDSPFLYSDQYRILSMKKPVPASPKSLKINLSQQGITPKIRDLAVSWTKGINNNRDKAGVIASRLKGQYKYSLNPPAIPEDQYPIEYFLLQSKNGHCEYFAGALCMILRSVGIPARVVEGFAGMEKTSNPNDFVVRFSGAHAWVEAALDDTSWTTLDATPASLNAGSSYLWRLLVDFYDSLEHNWTKYVVYYDRADQADLFRETVNVFTSPQKSHTAFRNTAKVYVPLILGSIMLIIVGVGFVRFRTRKTGPAETYKVMMKNMIRADLLTSVSSWHEDNMAETISKAPELEAPLKVFMEAYFEARFAENEQDGMNRLTEAGRLLREKVAEWKNHQL